MLRLAQLNNFLMDIMKELLVSGELDGVIQAKVKQMHQSLQEDLTAMVELSMALPSRQLDDILLDTISEVMCSRGLDFILICAVTEVLQTGILDGIILKSIAQLQHGVRLVIGIASAH